MANDKPAAADKPVSAFAAKVKAKQEAKAAAGSTGSRTIGSVAKGILATLRQAGQAADGLTTEEIRRKIGFPGSATQLRRRIRDAQSVAGQAGDLVLTDMAVSVTDEDGKEKLLPRATKRYYIVEKALAATLDAETLKTVRDNAVDFRFGTDTKSTSRASLQEG
jgi:hypothetical protein